MTDTTLPAGLTAETLALALAHVKATKDAEKSAREEAAKDRTHRFGELSGQLPDLLEAVALTHEVQTWHKRDPKTKQKTDKVSGIGFHVTGRTSMTFPDGTVRDVAVSMFVKANPNGGVPPEALDNEED